MRGSSPESVTHLFDHANGAAACHAGVPIPGALHSSVNTAAERQLKRHWNALIACGLDMLHTKKHQYFNLWTVAISKAGSGSNRQRSTAYWHWLSAPCKAHSPWVHQAFVALEEEPGVLERVIRGRTTSREPFHEPLPAAQTLPVATLTLQLAVPGLATGVVCGGVV